MWADETTEVRAKFKQQADNAKIAHARLHPGYTYQPRRPSDKKKRMTKKKIAALAAQTNGGDFELTSLYATMEAEGGIADISMQERESWEYNQRTLSLPMSPGKLAKVLEQDRIDKMKVPISDITGHPTAPALGRDVEEAAIYNLAQQNDMDLVCRLLGQSDVPGTIKEDLARSYEGWPALFEDSGFSSYDDFTGLSGDVDWLMKF